MAHNITHRNGQDDVAYLGSRKDVWHHLGQEMQPGQSIEEWAKAAGLDWSAVLVPVFANVTGIVGHDKFAEIPYRRAIARSDSAHVLGIASDRYQAHQPIEHLDFFRRQIELDDRFSIDAAGSINGGKKIWVTAKFNGDISVAGDKHRARLLSTTTFDGTGASINKMTLTRAICDNTLRAALGDGNGEVRTTHRSKFDAAAITKELAGLAQSVDTFKAVGDALAQNEMSREEVSKFFKTVLDIPFDAPKDDVSARKLNQFEALNQAYRTTVGERNGDRDNAFVALQAVTRYVDHDRSAKDEAARFASANFDGGGERMKNNAMQLLLPRIKDKVLLAA